jgi:ABC-2 type transport system permease protein
MGHFLIRTSAFLRKEMVEVLRQPRLILALVLGPFIILLLFGLGYRNEARPVRTLFLIDTKSPLAKQIEQFAPTISPQLVYMGTTSSSQDALQRLKQGQVDMVVSVPGDAYQTIRNNQQAAFTIIHNEIDPAQANYISYLGQILVQEVNRRVLSTLAQQGQASAGSIQKEVDTARKNTAAARSALTAGNVTEARIQQLQMQAHISSLSLLLGTSAGLLSGVQQDVGTGSQSGNVQSIIDLLNLVKNNPTNNGQFQDQTSYNTEIQQLTQQEQALSQLETQLSEFQSISPSVLTAPFTAQTQSVSDKTFTAMNFFTPGVIALLLQHIAITIAALSIVREKRAGTMELFRVSPITAGQALIGKYISYMIFGILIAGILALLLNYGLNAPMLGTWTNFAIVVILMLFSALGIGFLISLVAGTESQAVQFAMIALLLSVFFSGFILDLRYLAGPVQVVSWLLPATYGTIMLQNIMLRGSGIALLYLAGLLAIGVFLFILSWVLMRRQMALNRAE